MGGKEVSVLEEAIKESDEHIRNIQKHALKNALLEVERANKMRDEASDRLLNLKKEIESGTFNWAAYEQGGKIYRG
jgi:hypothetical protein